MQLRGARTHSSFAHAVHACAHRPRPHESTSTHFVPTDMPAIHVMASAAAFTCPATEGKRPGRWSEMRAWVGRPGANPGGILDYP
jgi:hypothetical protein